MLTKLAIATLVVAGLTTPALALKHGAFVGGGVVEVDFTPKHLYFMKVDGDNRNDGLTPATAWRTPGGGEFQTSPCCGNTPVHTIECGDVILVNTGDWQGVAPAGTASNAGGFLADVRNDFADINPATCPSTGGGIGGTGGINFAIVLCAGPDVMSCKLRGADVEAVRVSKGHWAFSGFWATQNIDGRGGCFTATNESTNVNTVEHFIAFINSITSVCNLAGYSSGGGGNPAGWDQIAVVGSVAFDSAWSISDFCGSGVSMFPGNPDATTGTHIFIAQYFGAYNSNRVRSGDGRECLVSSGFFPNAPHSDGEAIIFDTYAAGYTTPGLWNKAAVLDSAVMWKSGNNCVQSFPQGNGSTDEQGQYYVFNVTCYSSNQDPRAACGGELNFNQIYPTGTAFYQVKDSIFFATERTCGNNGGGAGTVTEIYGSASVTGHGSHVVALNPAKIDISGNWIWQSKAGTPAVSNVVGRPNTFVWDQATFDATWTFGTNNYGDPGMTSPSTLFSTTPDCTGYVFVTDCMNTKYGVYDKVKPTIAAVTKGYQKPGPCISNTSDPQYLRFPAFLKGIVTLVAIDGFVAGSRIRERDGLVTKRCGM